MSTQNDPKIELVHCNQCLHETDHNVIAERKIAGRDPKTGDEYVYWKNTYTLLECCGCHDITLRRHLYFSEWDEPAIDFYPPQISRRMPAWINSIPSDSDNLLREVYAALQSDSRRLAIMGARSLVDMFMNDKVGDVGGFEQKLALLVEKGYLSTVQKDILLVALETGHAVTHRGFNPKKTTVEQVMDVVENLLQHDSLSDAATDLRSVTPQRKQQDKK